MSQLLPLGLDDLLRLADRQMQTLADELATLDAQEAAIIGRFQDFALDALRQGDRETHDERRRQAAERQRTWHLARRPYLQEIARIARAVAAASPPTPPIVYR